MQYILVFIILIFIIIFLIDAFPQFYTWQSRIKIGRFQNREDWQNKVLKISKKWLQSTPTIKLTDNNRLIILDILKGNYSRTAIQSWQEAALVLGLSEYAMKTNNSDTKKQILNLVSSKMEASGKWKAKPTETDHAILAYAFLNSSFVDHQKYQPAFDETYQMIQSLKGSDGTVAYKKHSQDFRFVDTIGFICPFLVHYGLKFNIPEAIDLAILQITEYNRFGMMKERSIPCHTYHLNTKIPTGLFGWGRGIGWWVIGIIDTWKALPEHHPGKKSLEQMISETANAVIPFQNDNGSYNWLIFNKKSRLDSSTAATLAWFFTLAAQIPELSEICLNAREKCLNYLQSVTRRNGAVDFSQGDTKGIGIYSQNFDILPFTQGFLLRTLIKKC